MVKSFKPRVLFFIDGPVPTEEQREEAATMGPNVGFRNRVHIKPDDPVEPFDVLAGDPPLHYLEAAAEKAGEPLAPVAPPVDTSTGAGAALAGFSGGLAAPKAGGGGWKPNS